jgi:23S rRNA pseudouridine2605 synthase
MSLNKFLARAGAASRRGGDELIRQGRVTVNGEVVADLGRKVDPGHDAVKVDGKRVFTEEARYFLFHKPEGMVTTMDDPEGRLSIRNVTDRLPGRVFPVGRLDYNTAGLLLLTNDGELTQQFLHPKFRVPRIYEAKVNGILEPADFDRLRKGVRLEDGFASAHARPIRKMEKNSYLEVSVTEGRKHVVRRLLAAVGHEVIRLMRVKFGPLELGGLPVGQWRPLDPAEVKSLKQWAESNARKVVPTGPSKGKGGAARRPPGKAKFKNINLRQRNPGKR